MGPLSLGIETMGGVLTKLIESNTTIPVKKVETFSTAADNQPSVEIHVLQGERSMAKDNKTIGRFHLDGIPQAPRGIPKIEVTFDIDSNGILNVSAKNKDTGKEQNIRIEASSGLSSDEINQMKKEAEQNLEFDKKEKEKVEKINSADTLIFQTEKQLKEIGDKISTEKKNKILEELNKLKKSKEDKNLAEIDKSMSSLNNILMEASKEVYQSSEKIIKILLQKIKINLLKKNLKKKKKK